MSTEFGRVIGIESDFLWLETVSRSTCGTCSANKACGQGVMNRLLDGRRNQLKVALGDCSAADFQLGDQVEVSIPDQVLLSAAFIVYLLPLLTLVAGIALANQIGPGGDLFSAVGAGVGFIAGLAGVKVHSIMTAANPRFLPVVVGSSAIRPIHPPV
ncbi:SoxR reducing system RseC family protein [Spongiibacter taiwanensis]|uniref:SoxR reducing system RseC family protein n=1 Tax=Spongiibacter taiwanensis TaxID=1748242 RepID=UPI0020363C9A|nr:SoxR reducing system RseC family protein [Spongiibacter taiwanensis]USA43668.1 SoxR reducing system RseC family protein [Spongiibacter taiwanensis]